MKITFLKLKNFSSIYTSMNAKEIEIDFSKTKHKIILLNGPNGSGKTSILSCLHPFAYNGALDIRNDLPLIRDGKNGYKEIHILDDDVEYIIKHHYTTSRNGSYSVKSYIEKNSMELNPNGNVTGFKNIILEELDIEIDYLKLVRLGANVTNFIDLKATERKTFMGKILDEVEIYLKFFKKVSNDMRELKSILSHTVDKLEKLKISDPDDLKKHLKSIVSDRTSSQDELLKLNQRKAVVTHELEKLPNPKELNNELEITIKENKKMNSLLNSKKFNVELAETSNIDNLKEDILKTKMNIEMESNKRTMVILPTLNAKYSDLDDVEKQLEREENVEKLKSLEYIIADLETSVKESEEIFKDFSPIYTVKDVETVINILDSNQNILQMTYEFGKRPIQKVIKLLKDKKSIPEFVNYKMDTISSNRLTTTSNYVMERLVKKFPIIYPNCEDTNCTIYKFWQSFYDLVSAEPDDNDVEDEEFYTYMNHSYTNIKAVLMKFGDNKELFKKMPLRVQEMLTLDNVYKNISDGKWIYDRELMNNVLLEITEYEIYMSNSEKLKDVQYEYTNIKNSETKNQLKERLESISLDITKLNNSLTESTNTENSLKGELQDKEELLELSILTKKSIDEISESNKSVIDLQDKLSQSRTLISELQSISNAIMNIEFTISSLTKQENDIQFRLKEYKILNKDLKILKEKYDDVEYVRKSLSSREGIPLLHIKVYLKNTRQITNELLDIVYDGDLIIEDFDIGADEFKIPYIVNSKRVGDARYASQGEKSFISLALSFALSYQSITRYNIMLLDEIDSTLDTSNRAKFIEILEKQSEMIQSEQNFLITHNNMFDMYPVDILQLGDTVNKSNKLANYIKIKMK